jgi:hypothetical protein
MKFITLLCGTLLAALLTTQAHAAEGCLLSLDLDGDGKVNAEDLRYYEEHFGITIGLPGWNANADRDGSGKVTIVDKIRWLSDLETCLDLNRDGTVNREDLAFLEARLGVHDWHRLYDASADLDSSGKITASDGNLWLDAYAGIPDEPAPSDGVPTTEATAYLDVNGDGFLNDGDLATIYNGFAYSWMASYDEALDFDRDGEVDQVDINIWRDEYASMQSPGICDDLRYRHRSYAELIEHAQETGAEAASQLAIRLRTECDGGEPFVLVPGDIVYDSDGAISILRDGASHQLTLRLSGIQQIEIRGQSIVYSVELFEGSRPAVLQLFPDGHQELLLYPASGAFAIAE